MHPYTIQSYFKTLCDVYYIAYENKNRILKRDEELKAFDRKTELTVIEKLKQLELTEVIKKKYFSEDFSKTELEVIQEQLRKEQEYYMKEKEKINKEFSYWKEQMAGTEKQLIETIKKVVERGYYLIITSKKQIIPLISLFYKNEIKGIRFINLEEELLRLYPVGDVLCEEFFKAYSSEDYEIIIELYRKYF